MFSPRRLLAVAPLLALLSLPGFSQPSDPAYSFPQLGGPESMTAGQADRYSSDELDTLLKPLALFPDPLLAQILPAATFPDQVRAASLWLQANPGGDVNSQPWDDSVKAVAHYPTVIEQLNKDLEWTEAVGVAFSTQSTEVTSSVQRLRRMAYDSGNLGSTTQQIVSDDQNYLTIMPPTNQVVYVPTYNPQVVYGLRPVGYYAPMISFSIGYACGSWLSFGYDWLGGGCYRYPRGSYWGCNYGPTYRNVSYIHNTYNSCAWSAPRYSVRNVTINNNYRPGGGWSQQRSGGYQANYNQNSGGYRSNNGWSQQHAGNYQRSGGYRPGGDWSQSQNTRGWSQQSSGGYRPGGSWSHNSGSNGMPNTNPGGSWSHNSGSNGMPNTNPGGSWSHNSGSNGMPNTNPGGSWSHNSGNNGTPSTNPGGSWSQPSRGGYRPGGGWSHNGASSMPNLNPGGSWSHNSGGNGMPSMSPGSGWSHSSGGGSTPSVPSHSSGGWNRSSGGSSMPTHSSGGWNRGSSGVSMPTHSSGGWSRSSGGGSMPTHSSGGWNRGSSGVSMPTQSSGGSHNSGGRSEGGGGRRGRR